VLYFWRLGVTPLDDFDEAYYAEGAREMMERGDMGTPYYNGQPFLLKPILVYWLIAGSFRVFGVTEFAARFFSAFFAVVVVLTTYWFATKTISRRAGFFSGMALALSHLWLDTGREAMTDMPLVASLAPAVFLLFSTADADSKKRTRLFLTAYLLVGISVLAKGPSTTFIVLLGFVVYLAHANQLRAFIREARIIQGLILVLIVAAPWYIYETIREPSFFTVFFLEEHFGHLRGDLARDEPWYGHLKNLFIGFYPWIAFLPGALALAYRRERNDVLRFALWWAIAVIVIFSFAGAKLPHYLAPAYPPLAILVGGWFDAWLSRRDVRTSSVRLGIALLGIVGLLAATGAILAAAMPPFVETRIAARYGIWRPGLGPAVMLIALALGSLGAAALAAADRRRLVFPVIAGSIVIAALAHVGWFKPKLAAIQAQPRKELSEFAGSALPETEPLGVFYAKRNATIFYARRPIVDLGEWEPEGLLSFLSDHRPAGAITHCKFLPALEDQLGDVHVLMRRGEYVLIANHALGAQ